MNQFPFLRHPSGHRTFLSDLKNARSYSYGDLHHASASLASFLRNRSVASGDKIVYFTVNSGFFFPLFFACAATKAALVPLNPHMHVDELNNILKQLAPKIIFYDEIQADLKGILSGFEVVPVDGKNMLCLASGRGDGFSKDFFDKEDIDGRVALIIYTSGTTTNSKGVGLTYKNLYAMALQLSSFYDYKEGQRFLSMLPFYQINAPMITGLACILAEAHIFIDDVYGFILARNLWNIVEHNRIQVLSVTPSIMASLLALYPEGAGKDITSVQYALVGTAQLKPNIWRDFEDRFHVPCYQGYGLTETTTWVTMTPRDARKRYDTAGIPVGCELRVDPAMLSLSDAMPPGCGEVLVKGDIVMKGYWGNAEATRAVFMDGWLRTGDVGLIDQDGQLVIVGRIKNIIKRKGQLIVPEDIDVVIGRCSFVAESCTFGVPDEILGEKVVSACILKEGADNPEQHVLDFSREKLSQHNFPDEFIFCGCFPKNDVGKVNLRKLKEYVTGQTSREIVAVLDKARYRKAKTPDVNAIVDILQSALLSREHFYLLGFWGVGYRQDANENDGAVLDNLRKLLDEINKAAGKPVARIRLILADIHGRCNLVPEATARNYFNAIINECRKRDFECVYLSDIWSGHGLVLDDVFRELDTQEFQQAWACFPLKDRFMKQAKGLGMHQDVEAGARKYFAVMSAERDVVARYGVGNVFFTHNDPAYRIISPPLPTIYIHSIKSGTSEKPWFMGNTRE